MGSLVIPEWIIQLTTIVSSFSGLLVAIVAIRGINQWRVQMKFGDQYKTARKLRGLSLIFKREFGLARRDPPYCISSKREITIDELRKNRQELLDDFKERLFHLEELYKIVGKLYDESIEIEGFIDEKEAGITIPLEDAYRTLNRAFKVYKNFIESCDKESLKQLLEKYNIIFPESDDELSRTVDFAVENIRKRLKRYIA